MPGANQLLSGSGQIALAGSASIGALGTVGLVSTTAASGGLSTLGAVAAGLGVGGAVIGLGTLLVSMFGIGGGVFHKKQGLDSTNVRRGCLAIDQILEALIPDLDLHGHDSVDTANPGATFRGYTPCIYDSVGGNQPTPVPRTDPYIAEQEILKIVQQVREAMILPESLKNNFFTGPNPSIPGGYFRCDIVQKLKTAWDNRPLISKASDTFKALPTSSKLTAGAVIGYAGYKIAKVFL